ncbi:MAG: SDR family NAD(P)-dependent oxidoreductase [Lachnospiraceae bacterium]
MNIDLRGKTAIVTGGDGAIGTAICERFAQTGCNVIIVGIDGERAKAGKRVKPKILDKIQPDIWRCYGQGQHDRNV